MDHDKSDRRSYWCTIAVRYDLSNGYIIDQSEDCSHYDILIGGSDCRSNGHNLSDMKWVDKPGLYSCRLRPWSYQSDSGDWEGGTDIIRKDCSVEFPSVETIVSEMHCPPYWVIVALDYQREQAWICARSEACADGRLDPTVDEITDTGINDTWERNHEAGLYLLWLKPNEVNPLYSDVTAVFPIVSFPPRPKEG